MTSYKILFATPAREELASWGLSRRLLLEVHDRLLNRLAPNPDLLGEMIAPLQAREFSFTLKDESALPMLHHFMFAVLRDDESRTLTIIGCRHDTHEGGDN